MLLLCRRGADSGWPVRASQICAALPEDSVTIRVPSGLNSAAYNTLLCFIGTVRAAPVQASHRRALCPEVVRICFPSGLNWAEVACWPSLKVNVGIIQQ